MTIRAEIEQIPLSRAGGVVSTLAGAFGASLKEARPAAYEIFVRWGK